PSDRERDQLRRTATVLQAEVHFADVARPGTPLHDPGKLAAVLDGVRVRDGALQPGTETGIQSGPEVPPATATDGIPVDGGRQETGVHGAGGNGPRGDDAWR
ncbi:MAG: hypothetical protein QOG37_814, partial [Mycobacterium sp.]|nr:hypothetical protein [Mycobacterium sp.]